MKLSELIQRLQQIENSDEFYGCDPDVVFGYLDHKGKDWIEDEVEVVEVNAPNSRTDQGKVVLQ